VRVFAWEYVTAGGWRAIDAAPSMIAEGAMMVRALASDLAAVPGVRVVVAQDPAIDLGALPMTVDAATADDRVVWQNADAIWPIAPETGGLLEEATRRILRAGRLLLGSRLDALAIARSKIATARRLAAHGLPVVPTIALSDQPPRAEQGWVVKPDDGAGATDTYFLPDAERLRDWRAPHRESPWVVQPFIPGTATSLTILAQDGQGWLLSCNLQRVDCRNGAFAYRGGVVGGAEARRAVFEPLALDIVRALPGLWGLVGVDLIDRPEGPLVLEVNPRLTTSYVGLARSLGLNPAALVLALQERPLAALRRPLAPRPVAIAVPS
jgi:tyramine---L-glutamate ligase